MSTLKVPTCSCINRLIQPRRQQRVLHVIKKLLLGRLQFNPSPSDERTWKTEPHKTVNLDMQSLANSVIAQGEWNQRESHLSVQANIPRSYSLSRSAGVLGRPVHLVEG